MMKKTLKIIAVLLLLIIIIKGAEIYFSIPKFSTSFTSTNLPIPADELEETKKWDSYTSRKIGYTIRAPKNWNLTQNEDDSLLQKQNYLTNMFISTEPENAAPQNMINIRYPFNISGPHFQDGKKFERGLKGLEDDFKKKYKSTNSKGIASVYTTIDEQKALINSIRYTSAQGILLNCPKTCILRDIYIEMSNEQILWISTSALPGYEKTVDRIISTLKFSN